jgi:inosine/xanthosine triphosphatase
LKICVGSKNPTKVGAVEEIFPEAAVDFAVVSSRVSPQPMSDEETRSGAINRALECRKASPDVYGIGLEGGVMFIGDTCYLCNWGAMATPEGNIFTASGARIVLPEEISQKLKDGKELGEIMDSFAQRKEVRNKEGAIGIFTNDLISRKEMFSHVVKLLRGQWEYWNMEK